MTTIFELLSRGYFLRELPPPFTTVPFAQFIANGQKSATLPSEFTNGKKSAQLMRHDVPRIGGKRRSMAIPNPVTQFNLCNEIIQNWAVLDSHCRLSTLSCSIPEFNSAKGQAIIQSHSFSKMRDKRAYVRAFARYILRTDITKFYPSVYSHSIPWALHSKQTAKANRKSNLLGNILDERVRKGQDDQTVGIPIGPDSSFVIAEVILTAFDQTLLSNYPALRGFRRVDDMEFGFGTYREAEEVLALIRDILREYELTLNDTKTKIIQLPIPLDELWAAELRGFKFRTDKAQTFQNDIVTFFDKVFALQGQYPDGVVLKYAIQILRDLPFDKEAWELVQRYLFQCLMVDTSTFLFILPLLQNKENSGCQIDKHTLENIINFQIQQCSPLYYGNEVVWAIWAAIYWNLKIGEKAATAISKMTDSTVAIISLDAYHRHLIPKGLDTTNWEQFTNSASLYEKQWLLSYEANYQGWLNAPNGKDYVAGDPCFGAMKQSKVRFYDPNKATSVKLTSVAPSNIANPLFSF